MAIGSSLGITLPSQGGNTGKWGNDLNTELQKVIDAVEAQVPASAIDFSADFDLNGYAITSVEGVSFAQQSSYTTLNSLYFNTAGELYVRDGANNNFALTSGGALSGAGGSITGAGYGSSGIEINWDASRYNAKSGSGADDYADIRFNSAILRDDSGNDITLDAPSISSSYTLTLPTAVPASTGLFVQGTTGGALSFSNSTAQDITLTGSAELKHAGETKIISCASGFGSNTTGGYEGWDVTASTFSGWWEASAAGDYFIFPINLNVGDSISSITTYFEGVDGTTKTFSLCSMYYAGPTETVEETTTSTVAVASGRLLTVSPEVVISSVNHYYLKFDPGAAGDRVFHIQVVYNRP